MKEQLQTLRKSKNLTQEDVADIVGVKLSTYQKYERDVIAPSYDTLIKLADFYGVTTDYLLGREPAPNPLAELNVKVNDEKFIELYSALPDYAKQIFLDTMSRLAQAIEQANPNLKKQRHVERLGDIEDAREQEEQAKGEEETSCA